MKFNPFNLFARGTATDPANTTAGNDTADGSPPPVAGLMTEQAISQLVKYMTQLPDLDEVLRQAGVTRQQMRVLLWDDEVAQATETRLDALVTTPMRLEPTEGTEADTLREILKPVLRSILEGVFSARLYGYSVMEAVWMQRTDGKYGFQFVGEKPLEWFEPKSDGRLMYRADDGAGGTLGVEVEQQFKFFLTRVRPTYRNPYGEALLSRLYWPWFFRQNGWKFWGKFLERFGTPVLVGKSSDPTAMVAALLQAHSQAVIGIGPDDDVTTVGAASATAGQAFESFESACLRRIQKVILGQTMTSGTDGGSGNRALGQVHNDVRMDKRNSDIQLATETVQRIVDAVCLVNGFKRHSVVFSDDTGLELERAERDNKLYTMGVRFNPSYIADNYDLTEEDFSLASEADEPDAPPEPGPDDAGKPVPTKKPAATPAPKGGKSAKASQTPPQLFMRHGQGTRFTQQQQLIEDVADDALDGSAQPIPTDVVRAAILAATSPEDLADRLFALVGDKLPDDKFSAELERALYAADVLGYVHAEGKV